MGEWMIQSDSGEFDEAFIDAVRDIGSIDELYSMTDGDIDDAAETIVGTAHFLSNIPTDRSVVEQAIDFLLNNGF